MVITVCGHSKHTQPPPIVISPISDGRWCRWTEGGGRWEANVKEQRLYEQSEWRGWLAVIAHTARLVLAKAIRGVITLGEGTSRMQRNCDGIKLAFFLWKENDNVMQMIRACHSMVMFLWKDLMLHCCRVWSKGSLSTPLFSPIYIPFWR